MTKRPRSGRKKMGVIYDQSVRVPVSELKQLKERVDDIGFEKEYGDSATNQEVISRRLQRLIERSRRKVELA